MIATIKLTIDIEPDETMPSEAVAIERIQKQFAALAQLHPDELVSIWREAVKLLQQEQQAERRRRHRHGRKAGA